ncbi:hypothetical protein [Lysobacter sp.]|uniref:hypothetical protein n=1 Tax=Lysobacter sp. TaxID=72226 RepID=UPI002D228F60|nr:hypothetical protein [Lysobacter sp.]HZX77386.1 hypothetical protein [Lysobacter sp.]
MALGTFQIGQRFSIGEASYRIFREIQEGRWTLEDVATGCFREETTPSLLAQWSRGELRFFEGASEKRMGQAERLTALHRAHEDAFRQSYPEALWKRAQAKLVYIRKLEGVPITASVIVPRIQAIWEEAAKEQAGSDGNAAPIFEKPPHFTTVATWIRTYRDAGYDIRALIDRQSQKGSRDSKTDEIVERLADDAIATHYLTPARNSKAMVLKELRAQVAVQNLGRLASEKLPLPGLSYLKRRIAEIPPYDRCVARYGKRVADIRFRAAGMGAPAERPLARASIDHCRLDLMVVDEESGLPLGRPWLTLVLDECTRNVLGFYLGFEEPSVVSVMRAIRDAIMPKDERLAAYPKILNAWDAWGVIEEIVADNGMELHSEALEQAIGRFGMRLQFCPRRKPWYKGKVERFFRTLRTGLVDTIPGKTFHNILARGDYNPTKHAVVRLSTLREIVLTWLVDIYHQEPHRGLDSTPAREWQERIQGVDRWLPPSSLSIESAFSRKLERRLTHKGIELDCLFYNSHELRAVREQYGNEIHVEVRAMDEDVGSIIVVVPAAERGGEWLIRVPALDQAYAAGLTRWQHEVCKRYQRRILDDEAREVSLLAARDRIRELIRMDMDLVKRSSRKKQARFMETGRAASTPAPSPAPTSTSTPPPSPSPPPSPDVVAPQLARLPVESIDEDVPSLVSRRVTSSENLYV